MNESIPVVPKAARGARDSRWLQRAALVAAVLVGIAAAPALAANVGSVQVGDVYYLWRWDRANDRVVVREVDRASARVKVAYASGELRWVAAASLKTRDEAASADVGVAATAVGAALVLCAIDPEACRAAAASGGGSGGFLVTNACRHPVRVAIHYRRLDGTWSSQGWWNVGAGSTTYLADGANRRLVTDSETWFYYAETTDAAQLAWKGDHVKSVGDRVLPMARLVDNQGDSEWTLRCDGQS